MTANQKQLEAYQGANREAARIIAADPVKYPPDSLLGEWASLVLDREKTAVDTPAARPLFETEAA